MIKRLNHMKRYDLLPENEKTEMLNALRDEWICDEKEIPSIEFAVTKTDSMAGAEAFFTGWLCAKGYHIQYQEDETDQWVKKL